MRIEIVYTRKLTRKEIREVTSVAEAEAHATREADELTTDLFEEGQTFFRLLPARGDGEAHQAIAEHLAASYKAL